MNNNKPIITDIRASILGLYGHVMRKGDDGWANKCLELKAEGQLEDQEGHG